jgi:DNA adenine methylase
MLLRADATSCSHVVRPLLKWPGGKRLLAKYILQLMPERYSRYIEPFVGGGAVYFALRPYRAVLGDSNSALINCYRQVRDYPEAVARFLGRMKNSEDCYYSIRKMHPRAPAAEAARLIYLTNLSFNGIYRLNADGDFNVPYGHRPERRPASPNHVRSASNALRAAALVCQDFEVTMTDANDGDVVYLDPPYTVAHSNNGFIRYNARLFSWSDQERLASAAARAVERGAFVIVSNADHNSVRSLYRTFTELQIERESTIASTKNKRKTVIECLFYAGRSL